MNSLTIDGTGLNIDTVEQVAKAASMKIELSETSRRLCNANRMLVERLAGSDEACYGINTGFGDLARVRISKQELARLQVNLVRSHAVATGEPLPRPAVRAAMLLRANTLARGVSGVRPELIDGLLELLSRDVVPVIPSQGSLGASGDLAPLAHMALVLIGEGQAMVGGETMPGSAALARVGLQPLELKAKEGLALINGTPVMTALASLSLSRAEVLLKNAIVIAAMSIEALRGSDDAFDDRIHELRGHPGQRQVAGAIRALLAGSGIRASHVDCDRVQDAYSLRCSPQVLGASLEAWKHCRQVVERELNAVTDNPLVFEDGVVSGGNFHGEPVGMVMDYFSVAMAEVGSISERRCFRLLTTSLSDLPAFLVSDGGLNSGLMIVQYTAASLVSENKVLAHPATVDSIPSSADQEDHVSMATTAARQAASITGNLVTILAAELLAAGQALELLSPLTPSPATAAVLSVLREQVDFLSEDRWLGPDLEAAARLVDSEKLYRAASEAADLDMEDLFH